MWSRGKARGKHTESRRPTAQAIGGALLFRPHLPPPPGPALCFCFIVLKFSVLAVGSCRCGDTYSLLVSPRVDSKDRHRLVRMRLARGLGALYARAGRGLANFVRELNTLKAVWRLSPSHRGGVQLQKIFDETSGGAVVR